MLNNICEIYLLEKNETTCMCIDHPLMWILYNVVPLIGLIQGMLVQEEGGDQKISIKPPRMCKISILLDHPQLSILDPQA